MKTQITIELLQTMHDRIREVCIAKYDIDPDTICLDNNGTVYCQFTPHYNYADTESYTIEIGDLQAEDLDELINIRKENERIEQEKHAEEYRIATERRLGREKEERRTQYEKLRKEFES